MSAERERVFDAWTKPELMQQWLFPEAGCARTSNDLRVGGTYSHEMIFKKGHESSCKGVDEDGDRTSYPHHGEYLELKRPERIVFTWNSPAVTNTRVTVDLKSVDGGTEVVITHELLDSEDQRKSHTEGWRGCLDNLAAFLG
ncbi:MAG: SRPBCC domain-containing protein [Deltaproteobacteria bacterium]|nr:SRPBCC domain-containing protein [Deltaproteobacteria bacterium]